MPSETEELRLRVVLDDQASAALSSLKQNIAQLGSGSTAANLEKFKREQINLGEQFKRMIEVTQGGDKALIGLITRFGALGVALGSAATAIRVTSEQLGNFVRLGERLGVPAAQLKNISDQFLKVGIDTKTTSEMMEKFTHIMVEAGRIGSETRQHLIEMGGQHGAAVAQMIDKINQEKDAADALKDAWIASEEVAKDRFEKDMARGKSREEATKDAKLAQEEWLQAMGLNAEAMERMHGNFTKMTDAQLEALTKTLEQQLKIDNEWNLITAQIKLAGEQLVTSWGPTALKTLQDNAAQVKQIYDWFKAVDDYLEGSAIWKWFQGGGGGDPGSRAGKSIHDWLLGGGGANFNDRFGNWPSHQHGTNFVPRTGLAMLHRGEQVIPPGGFGDDDTRDNTRVTDENTTELKRLNDYLEGLGEGGGPGGMGGGLGGFHGGAGGGFGGGGGGGGGRGGSTASTPDGSVPSTGSDGKTGSAAGHGMLQGAGGGFFDPFTRGAGPVGGTHGVLGGPGGKGFFDPFTRGAAPVGGGGGGGGGGLGTLAQQRAGFMKELNDDPQLKNLAIGAMSKEGGIQSNLEQLFNYASMRGMSIKQALYSGQYGPVTGRNRLSTQALAGAGSAAGQRGEAALAAVGAGSNITDFATDQGMAGDPNFAKYMSNKSYWNMHQVEGAWFSSHGEAGRAWAAKQRAAAAAAGQGNVATTSMPSGASSSTAAGVPRGIMAAAEEVAVASRGDPGAVNRFLASQGVHKDTQWCGDFAAAVVKRAGYQPPAGYPVATSWARWGEADPSPHPGDVAVAMRGLAAGQTGGHVAIVRSVDPKTGQVTIEGGNQGALIQAQREPMIYRRPTEAMQTAAQDRATVDAHRVQTVKVEGSGKLTANINAPKGTDVTLEGGGLFKKTEIARQAQMTPARPGAGAGVAGHGTAL